MTSSNTAFAGILLRVSTVPALRMAGPAALIVFVVAFGLHGESTLTFRELGQLYIGEPALRGTILALWILVMAPPTRAAFMADELSYLRWLPLPRSLIHTHLVAILAFLHLLPVLPLFIAGFPAPGIGMWLAMMGIAACALPGARGAVEHAVRALSAGGLAALVADARWLPAIGAALVVLAWRVPRVWRLAPEHSHWRSGLRLLFGGRWLSLLSAQVLHIWRSEAATLSRALLVSALGVFLIKLVYRANQGYISEGSLLVTSTPTIAAVSIMLAIVLRRARRQLDWLLRSLGVSRSREHLASLVLIATGGSALATTMVVLVGAPPLQFGLLLLHTISWSLLALGISSRSKEDVRSASITLAVAFFAMFAIGLGGRASLGAELGLGLLAAGRVLLRETHDA